MIIAMQTYCPEANFHSDFTSFTGHLYNWMDYVDIWTDMQVMFIAKLPVGVKGSVNFCLLCNWLVDPSSFLKLPHSSSKDNW